MQNIDIAEVVEEIIKSLQELKGINLEESPTVSDYADALPAVLFYARIMGKADSFASLSKLIGMDNAHLNRAIHRKFPEQAQIEGRFRSRGNPYVSIYRAAMRGLELPDTIDPRIWTKSYHAVAEAMLKVIHGVARAKVHDEYTKVMDRYANIQVPGIRVK